jgi:hypothetical protein
MQVSRLRGALSSLLLLFVLAFAIGSAYAVDVNARIKGTVTDPSGAVVPNAVVTATNTATGVKYPGKSNASGEYLFPQLPVGTYSITVSAPGFKGFTATGITLTIDQEYVEPVKLEVGNASETLEVAADAVQVNTTDMQLSNIVNSQQMVELPLIGRNFTGLELIEPGVQSSSDRFGSYSVSGAETQQSSFLINGADTNDLALNTQVLSPNLDAIDQFALIDGPLNAEYDRNSGGIVSATIKQGTNHIHGDAFEFYRDTFLNTANFFQTTTTSTGIKKTVTTYHQNIFGGTIGAPILRDKIFAFGAYQGTRQVVPGTNGGGNATVFTAAQRAGDFSADVTGTNPAGYNFATAATIPASFHFASCPGAVTWGDCIAANGGKFNSADFNPIAVKLLSTYVPLPNSGANGYVFDSTSKTSADQFIGRLDFNFGPKNQVTFVGIYHKQAVISNIPFTGASLPGFDEDDAEHIQQYTVDYVRQFNATLVNDFGIHYTRFNYAAVNPLNPVAPSTFGFSINPQITSGQSLPLIQTGYFNLGFSNNGPQPRIDQVYQLDDNVSKTHGHHQFKFGYDGRKFGVSNPFGANNNGTYSYSGAYSSGDPGLDFLLGNPGGYAQGSGAQIIASAYLNYIFAQDNWKATNTLTVSYGLGYQIDTTLNNKQYGGEAVVCLIPGQQSKIFPSAPPSIDYPGDPGCTNSGQAYTRFGDLGPRIGFAWAPDLGWLSGAPGKFSIRGGFGIYYNRSEEETSLNNLQTPPFGLGSAGAKQYNPNGAPGFANPYVDTTNNVPGTPGSATTPYKNQFPFSFPTPGSSPDFSLYEPGALSTYGPTFRSPYSENFQLTVQRELPARIVAGISYVGALGRHNQVVTEGNYVTPAGHAACLADTTFCSNLADSEYRDAQNYYFPSHTVAGNQMLQNGAPAFPAVDLVGAEGASNYNSLQVNVTKAPTHGLSFQLSYTWAHALDNASSYENAGYGGERGYNQFQPGLNYGDSQYDARQRLVIAPIYVTPQLHSGSWYSPKNLALSGWQISGITTLATGFPFDTAYNGGSSNAEWYPAGFSYYAGPDEPNSTAHLTRGNPRTFAAGRGNRTTWYTNVANTFSVAPLGTFGNAARNTFHGPGINNTNMILAKNFNLSADGVRRLQLRMESDNVFNHASFANPTSAFGTQQLANPDGSFSTGLTSGNSGLISGVNSSYPARQTQLAAKFYF